MIKKLLGILFFAAGIAIIVAVMLRHGSFRSMAGWDSLTLRRSTEQTAATAPATDEFTHPAGTPTPGPAAPADSLSAPAADSCAWAAPNGSIH